MGNVVGSCGGRDVRWLRARRVSRNEGEITGSRSGARRAHAGGATDPGSGELCHDANLAVDSRADDLYNNRKSTAGNKGERVRSGLRWFPLAWSLFQAKTGGRDWRDEGVFDRDGSTESTGRLEGSWKRQAISLHGFAGAF